MNGYDLSRQWFDFAFENPELITGNHAAVFMWNIELNNRMGWASKFSSPSGQAMAATGIKSYNTYKKVFDDLVAWGFIKVIQESKNQYSACIIALSKFDNPLDNALDKSLSMHLTTQSESSVQSTDDINKQETSKPINKKPINHDFVIFWDLYGKKEDKAKSQAKWERLTDKEREQALEDIPNYLASLKDRAYQKNPLTYLNGKCWLDERTHTSAFQETKVMDLSPEVEQERQRRKSQYDNKIFSMPYLSGQRVEFPDVISIYHQKTGYYDELKN